MNRSSRRINKRKAIPLCFQKSQSNSQFLAIANYKHQIKKLKKVNKELACSLQDAKCRAADQERALAECTQENTQAMFVKMKIKDIVETVKKLVTDLGEVYDVMDGKSFDFLRNLSTAHQEARLQIRNPSISTIEESASMSAIEPDLYEEKEESISVESSTRPTRIELPVATPSFDADSSQTEIYNVPLVLASEQKLQKVSNGNQSVVARSSKSLEHTGSFPLDPDSPPTPQPPVLLSNFQLSIESQSLVNVSKLKPISSQVSAESQRSSDLPKLPPITATSTTKSTLKSAISKIPVKKSAASTKDNSPLLASSSSHMNRRKTFVVDGKVEEPQIPLPVSDRRGTIVLDSLPDNAKSGVLSDRRGTFVLSSLPDNAKSDIISDRRSTFVLKPLTDDTKPDEILDRRATYFIPTQSKEQPDISPPKIIETNDPVQSAATNHTILLSEDMELTEILPLQNQSHQFIPILPPWNEKLETDEPGLNEKLSAPVRDQPLSTSSFIKQFPISNTNSSDWFEVDATHGVVKDAQIQNIVNVKKGAGNKSLASNILSKTKLLAETSASSQDVNPTDPQQKIYKETDVEIKMRKKEDIIGNIKCSNKKPPSPIAFFTRPDMSIQHKIFESFSAVSTEPDKNKPTSDGAVVAKRDDHKESSASKDTFSTNQPAVAKVTVKEVAESPKTERRSGRKLNKCFDNFFSDSDESDINFDDDFIPEKRFSLKPGRKIINPNNNKVFVFKKNSKKQSTKEDTSNNLPPDKSEDEDIENDQERDIFNFSASSEAEKSPLTKSKKRKSVMPKNNRRSVNKQSDVGKRLSKTKNKRSSKPEINKDEVPGTPLPRKSILSLNKGNSPLPARRSTQFSRKSVRFTLFETAPKDEINYPKCDSPMEENINPVNQESDDIHDTEKVSSHNTRGSQGRRLSSKKKSISARSSSLTATGNILKNSSVKSKRSRKRRSCNLNSDLEDVCESGCTPKKKMFQVSNETPPQMIETCTNFSCEKQEQSKDVKDRFEPSQYISGAISSEVSEEELANKKKEKKSRLSNLDTNGKVAGSTDEIEKTEVNEVKRPFSRVSECISNKKQSIVADLIPSEVHKDDPTDRKTEKNSGRVLSELPQNFNANVKVTGSAEEIEGTNVDKAKRPFSGVSERRSNKKQSIVDELFPSLNDAICEMVDDNIETAFKLIEDEPTEIYNVKEMAKSVETDCNKGSSVTVKTPKQKSESRKNKSSKRKKTSKQCKEKENTPNNAELKLDVLTSDNNLCTLLGFKESVEKTVKPKISRKKKESAPLHQEDLKADVLTFENAIGSDEAVGGRSRRRRTVMSFKEPSLHTKMRRE